MVIVFSIHQLQSLTIQTHSVTRMTFLLSVLVWFVLLVLCWPLALIVLLMWPLLWLLSIPFRIIGLAVGAVLALVKAILFLPARLLGAR